MTDITISADIITLRKKPLTPAERARAYRARKREKSQGAVPPAPAALAAMTPVTPPAAQIKFPVFGILRSWSVSQDSSEWLEAFFGHQCGARSCCRVNQLEREP
jgi:hypothetical protein